MITEQVQIVKVGSGVFRTFGIQKVCAFLAEQIAALWRADGIKTLIVTSGAGVCGETEMGGTCGFLKQTVASIGQPILMEQYRVPFRKHDLFVSQVLETDASILHRIEWGNTKQVIDDCFAHGAIPIVNENDAVSVQQFLTDNDQLTALLAEALHPQAVLFITDAKGVFQGHPDDSESVQYAEIDYQNPPHIEAGTSKDGRGGMNGKLTHALSCYAGGVCRVAIVGLTADVIVRVARGEAVPTSVGTVNRLIQ